MYCISSYTKLYRGVQTEFVKIKSNFFGNKEKVNIIFGTGTLRDCL